MQIKNALVKLSEELDGQSQNHTVDEIIMSLPKYLETIPLTEKQYQKLAELVKEYCSVKATTHISPGSNIVSLVGVLNWLDCRCREYCENNCNQWWIRSIKDQRRQFSERGGWRRYGVV